MDDPQTSQNAASTPQDTGSPAPQDSGQQHASQSISGGQSATNPSSGQKDAGQQSAPQSTSGQSHAAQSASGGQSATNLSSGQSPAGKSSDSTSSSQGAGQQNSHGSNKTFDIPDSVKDKHSDLIPLILETESMNDEERQYWFHILPIMTSEQVKKFRDILENEKKQLAKLDKEYEEELKRLNDTDAKAIDYVEQKEKWQAIRQQEVAQEKQEEQSEEDILQQLEDV